MRTLTDTYREAGPSQLEMNALSVGKKRLSLIGTVPIQSDTTFFVQTYRPYNSESLTVVTYKEIMTCTLPVDSCSSFIETQLPTL